MPELFLASPRHRDLGLLVQKGGEDGSSMLDKSGSVWCLYSFWKEYGPGYGPALSANTTQHILRFLAGDDRKFWSKTNSGTVKSHSETNPAHGNNLQLTDDIVYLYIHVQMMPTVLEPQCTHSFSPQQSQVYVWNPPILRSIRSRLCLEVPWRLLAEGDGGAVAEGGD
jgi:hypothetical protein